MRLSLPPFVKLLAVLALGLHATPAGATDQAGVSAAVKGQVALNRPQASVGRQVVGGEPIFLQDAIQSGPRSGMQILLLDETVFTIGPESELVVDEFVYDPQTNKGKVSAQITKGVFRFVTGRVAHENPADMNVKLPSGTLGVRGTIVAGSADPVKKSALLVLLGEGHDNDTGSPASAFEACNAGVCKQVRRPGYGLSIDGPDAPPSDPFLVPLPDIDRLTQSVSDPAGWVETAKSDDGATDVAAGEPGAQDGDTRSATEVSGRSDAGSKDAAERDYRRLNGVDQLDRATTNAQQDVNEEQNLPAFGQELAEGGELPELPLDLSNLPFGIPIDLLSDVSITSFADVAVLAATPNQQSASYFRDGIALDDGGSYSFELSVDFGPQTANISVWNIFSPSLGLNDAGFHGASGLDDLPMGVPFAAIFDTITDVYSTGCRNGCEASAAAILVNGQSQLAERAFHFVEINAESGIDVTTATTPVENMVVPRD